ncbi:MAG: carbon starvation protein A [Desulfurococcales archaeon]|nr:carbon starvation protein A [Desulfurococcales archaeon]
MAAYAIEVALIVVIIYGIAYLYYGKKILQEKIVKADPNRPTPAFTKFDGVDYVPANKYVLYGHHFASIAGAGPIVGPAIAMAYGWLLPLIWVLFGNVFIGAVHDYLAVMASVRYGGLSVMSISENVMGRKARYIFLVYVYAALILVVAAFASVAALVYTKNPSAATKAIIYMPIALLLGVLVYRLGTGVTTSTVIAIILVILGFYYAYKVPLILGYDPATKTGDFWGTYHLWVSILSFYAFIAASLPVWYLLQPRDYLNAYLLWFFVVFAIVGALLVGDLKFTGPAYTSWSPKIIGGHPTPFWPAIPLIIACGALSGFHSVVGSGTTSKQLSNELDALLIGYGGMLTEGAVSSLAVITPISLAWAAPELTGVAYKTSILELDKVSRFVVGYGYMTAKALSRFGLNFNDVFSLTKLFAAIALATFILTTLDTATRLARFAWQEMFDWLQEKNLGAYKVLTNRFVATFLAVFLGWALAFPEVTIGGKKVAAFNVVWPAFAGTNQLLAALALLTTALWVYSILKVRGAENWLIQIPAWFLWITVTLGLIWWTAVVLPGLPTIQKYGAGSIVLVSLALDFLLIYYFVKGLMFKKTA